jgi:hypothetical protein
VGTGPGSSYNDSATSEANLLKDRCETAVMKLRALSDEVENELKHAESIRRAHFEARNYLKAEGDQVQVLPDRTSDLPSDLVSHPTTDQKAETSDLGDPR